MFPCDESGVAERYKLSFSIPRNKKISRKSLSLSLSLGYNDVLVHVMENDIFMVFSCALKDVLIRSFMTSSILKDA